MITEKQFTALRNVIEYLYEDEKENWENSDKPHNHIFEDIQIISDFVKNY